MRVALPVLALLAVLAVALPAQALVISSVDAPSEPIQPDIGSATVLVTTQVDCRDLVPMGGNLHFDLRGPPGIVFSGPTDQRLQPCQSPQGVSEQTQVFQASLSRDLPGLRPLALEVRAFYNPMQYVPSLISPSTAEAAFQLVGDAWFAGTATVREPVATCVCNAIEYTIELSNLGNVDTTYAFEVAQGDAGSVQLPSPVLVRSAPGAGPNATATATAIVRVLNPSPAQEPLQLLVRPTAAVDPSKAGTPMLVNLLTPGTSLAPLAQAAETAKADAPTDVAELPSVGPSLVFGLLGLAGLLRRRA